MCLLCYPDCDTGHIEEGCGMCPCLWAAGGTERNRGSPDAQQTQSPVARGSRGEMGYGAVARAERETVEL